MSGTERALGAHDEMTLVELVNRVVDRGIVLSGDLTIAVADVDLLHLDLRLMLCSADRMRRLHEGNAAAAEGGPS